MAATNSFRQSRGLQPDGLMERPEANGPEVKRLESIRSIVGQLREILLDPELACSVEVLNAVRPQLEAATRELAGLEVGAFELQAVAPGTVESTSSDALSAGNDLNFRVTRQLQLLHSELHQAESLRANASEFWKGWSKLLGVESDAAGIAYSAAGSGGTMPGQAIGNVSIRG